MPKLDAAANPDPTNEAAIDPDSDSPVEPDGSLDFDFEGIEDIISRETGSQAPTASDAIAPMAAFEDLPETFAADVFPPTEAAVPPPEQVPSAPPKKSAKPAKPAKKPAAGVPKPASPKPGSVSYTHLTLPTIYSV